MSWLTLTAQLFWNYVQFFFSICNAEQTLLCIHIIKVINQFTDDSLTDCISLFVKFLDDFAPDTAMCYTCILNQ